MPPPAVFFGSSAIMALVVIKRAATEAIAGTAECGRYRFFAI
jgi:hypothetical protein